MGEGTACHTPGRWYRTRMGVTTPPGKGNQAVNPEGDTVNLEGDTSTKKATLAT